MILFDENKQNFSNPRLVCTGIKTPWSYETDLTAKKVHKNNIFSRQDRLEIFKDYKYVKSPKSG